jgi:hypothetical protein
VPLIISRGPLISATWKEPFPGWQEQFDQSKYLKTNINNRVDTISSLQTLYTSIGISLVKYLPCNFKNQLNIVPVDVYVNHMIAISGKKKVYQVAY